jgi:hypothetical protein
MPCLCYRPGSAAKGCGLTGAPSKVFRALYSAGRLRWINGIYTSSMACQGIWWRGLYV